MSIKKIGVLCLFLLSFASVGQARIIFGSFRDGISGIYVIDDDGRNQTLLTDDLDPFPNSWSPDGKQILFTRQVRTNTTYALYLMNPDGTNAQQLTPDDGSFINGGRFSPDGKSIVFTKRTEKDGKRKVGIYVLNIMTGKMKKISDEWGIQCDWSPDGKHIVFARGQSIGEQSTIWIMRSDGHNPRPLLPVPGPREFTIYRSRPRWSPDGKQIVFQEKEYKYVLRPSEGNFPVFKSFQYIVCDINGENIEQLEVPKSWEGMVIDWMDNGKSVVFAAYVELPLNKPLWRGFEYPPCNIYKYDLQTTKIEQLTYPPGIDGSVDWISDDVLPVSAVGKKNVTWGTLMESKN